MIKPVEVWLGIKHWATSHKDTEELPDNNESKEAEPDIEKAISVIQLTSETMCELMRTVNINGDGETDSEALKKYLNLAVKALRLMQKQKNLDKDVKIYKGSCEANPKDFSCKHLVILDIESIPRCKLKNYCSPIGCNYQE